MDEGQIIDAIIGCCKVAKVKGKYMDLGRVFIGLVGLDISQLRDIASKLNINTRG